jgi:hypothetical protein
MYVHTYSSVLGNALRIPGQEHNASEAILDEYSQSGNLQKCASVTAAHPRE